MNENLIKFKEKLKELKKQLNIKFKYLTSEQLVIYDSATIY